MTVLTVPTRFRGPARSGNGGWTAGALSERVRSSAAHPTVQVTLRRPPPLEVPLTVVHDGARVVLADGAVVVAEALETALEATPVDEVTAAVAERVMADYPGLRTHPFPGCFACGPERAEGDGLRIFPGPVPGAPRTVASLWVPQPSLAVPDDAVGAMTGEGPLRVGVPTTWAALDCVGGWSEDLVGRPMVLGRITARVDALPVVGERHVVVGQRRRVDGRKTFTASTLYDSEHRVVAVAEHVWLAVDPSAFN